MSTHQEKSIYHCFLLTEKKTQVNKKSLGLAPIEEYYCFPYSVINSKDLDSSMSVSGKNYNVKVHKVFHHKAISIKAYKVS